MLGFDNECVILCRAAIESALGVATSDGQREAVSDSRGSVEKVAAFPVTSHIDTGVTGSERMHAHGYDAASGILLQLAIEPRPVPGRAHGQGP
jgi:hypothetical protein